MLTPPLTVAMTSHAPTYCFPWQRHRTWAGEHGDALSSRKMAGVRLLSICPFVGCSQSPVSLKQERNRALPSLYRGRAGPQIAAASAIRHFVLAVALRM